MVLHVATCLATGPIGSDVVPSMLVLQVLLVLKAGALQISSGSEGSIILVLVVLMVLLVL